MLRRCMGSPIELFPEPAQRVATGCGGDSRSALSVDCYRTLRYGMVRYAKVDCNV